MPSSRLFASSMRRFKNCQSAGTKSPQIRSVWLVSMSTDLVCSKTLQAGLSGWSDCQSIGPNENDNNDSGDFNRINDDNGIVWL